MFQTEMGLHMVTCFFFERSLTATGKSKIAPPPDSLRFLPLALLLSLVSHRLAPGPFPLFPLHLRPFQPTNELQHVVELLKTYLSGTVDKC